MKAQRISCEVIRVQEKQFGMNLWILVEEGGGPGQNWCAYVEGHPNGTRGYGWTVDDAIDDLLIQREQE